MKWNIKTVSLLLAGIAVAGFAIGILLLGAEGFNSEGGFLAGRDKYTIDTERLFPAGAVEAVHISTVNAYIRWRQTDGGQIKVHVYGVSNLKAEQLQLQIKMQNKVLEIEISPRRSFFFGAAMNNLFLDIYLPNGTAPDVDILTVSGNVAVEALTAKEFKLKTVSGDLRAGNLTAAKTLLNTTSGDFQIGGPIGDLEFRSVSGDLAARYDEFANTVKINTVSGDIRLDLPVRAEFILNVNSVSGDVECGFPILITGGRRDHMLSGTAGGGRNRIEIRTVSGDVRVD